MRSVLGSRMFLCIVPALLVALLLIGLGVPGAIAVIVQIAMMFGVEGYLGATRRRTSKG